MKREPVQRIDLRTTTTTGGIPGPSIIIQTGSGNADRLDGYDSSMTGAALTIPVLDEYGKLPVSALPYSDGEAGVRYVGPTTRLATALAADGVYLDVADKFVTTANHTVILSRFGQDVEMVRTLSTPVDRGGGVWRYAVSRAVNGTKAQAWARGAAVISLGQADSDGYVVINSGSRDSNSARGLQGQAPYLATYENVNGTGEWRAQFGRLSNVPDTFKDLFSNVYDDPVIDWDTFGFAGQNAFLSGGIYAQYGNIAGNLDVTGMLTVYDANTPARISFGRTPAGFGMSLRDQQRRPIWTLASAYYDEESGTYDSDTVWVVESDGKRVIWLHDEGGSWRLDVGPFLFADYGFYSRSLNDVGVSRCIIHPDVLYQFGLLAVYDNPDSAPGYKAIFSGDTEIVGNLEISGDITHSGSRYGAFNATPVERQLVTGSRDGNAALASLLTALANLGWITDGTTA